MTIHDPSLRAALKTLKLTGMLDTLDARLAQTRDGKLGHLEFLQVLCEDEIARRETAALARRVRRARFEQPNTFEDFDFTVSPKLPAAMLRDLAALRWLEAGESVILYGPVGVGKPMWHRHSGIKSHSAAATSASSNAPACSPTSPAATPTAPSDNACANTPAPLVLIVDDFAMREHTPTQSDDLYDLVSDRAIAAKPLILTSNRAPKDWYPLFPEPGRGRIAARPTHQHQPPSPHGRPVLPTPETTRHQDQCR
ncbi:putative ATP-binding protein in insertion sequence [Mycolicibacterium sarraceniae]|uniref:Putative ATP-binding protein in insertion sequence n=1 Tax=Mycolicibacterium sarraceniae TaxID=1534348 RepID=A0A7I7SS50_9MYCO|nr:putative ATP-binding protein in insertion sequence [Mycolicibacterium sarraceniae]